MRYNIIYVIIVLFIFTSCKKEFNISSTSKEVQQITNSKASSEGTFLFSGKNETIINWTEQGKSKEDNILKFSFFVKETKSFSSPIVVTPSKGLQTHAESMAKVAITKAGILYAFFRIKSKNSKSKYGGILYYAISSDRGQNWSDKNRVVFDVKSTSQSFYDVAQLSNGELGIVWLDKRKLHSEFNGQTLYFATTNKSNKLVGETAVEGSVCQCCRTEIEVGQNNEIHIAFRNMIEPHEMRYPTFVKEKKEEIRDMYYTTSKDNGKSFSKSMAISDDFWFLSGCPHTGPSLANNNNTTGAVWFTGANYKGGIYFTTKNTNDFNERELVSVEGRHPQMITINNTFYIVYEEYYEFKNKGYTKIILQERTSKKIIKTTEISTSETENSHAVLKQINDNEILISWINDDIKNSVVKYVIYNINK